MLERRDVYRLARDHGLAGELAEDQTFEQGVAAEPVGAVQAGGGDLAAGVEVLDAGAGRGVGLDAADHVMGAGPDRDQVVADVDVEALAQVADHGESLGEVLFIEVPHVEVDVGRVGLAHLGEDGPADDVARGQLTRFVIVLHEAPALGVQQIRRLRRAGSR